MESTISTLIWASQRVEVKELGDVRKQFRSKYGKKFDQAALNNEAGVLNERIVAKLSIQPPTAFLVQTYLEKIADQFHVEWSPVNRISTEALSAPMAAPVGYSVAVAPGSGLASGGGVATAPSFPPSPAAYPVPLGTGQSRQSDDVSEMGSTSASILSNIGNGKSNGNSNGKSTDERTGGGNSNNDDDDDENGDIPVAEVMTSTASNSGRSEPEIYIPSAPRNAKPDDLYIPPAPGAKTTGLDDDNNDNFEDIQARFANLKR